MLRKEDPDEHTGQNTDIGGEKNVEDDDNVDDNQTVISHVQLARTIRKSILSLCHVCQYDETENLTGTCILEGRYSAIDLAQKINQPALPELIRRFLYDQKYPDCQITSAGVSLDTCPRLPQAVMISVFSSAAVTYYAPSDSDGLHGLRREHIRATPSWRRGPARYDCVFVNSQPDLEGMRGLDVVRIFLFFSFTYEGVTYPCAFVHWYTLLDEEPDEDTGMWKVTPEKEIDGSPIFSVIHLDSIFRAAHLLPIYAVSDNSIPYSLSLHETLDTFSAFYVNKFIDHHTFHFSTRQ
jgi:hypothetical protein